MAKEMWASDHSATNGTVVREQDLVRYNLVTGRTGLVTSVDGESYTLNVIGVLPEAQLQKDWGTRFPKGTIIQWNTNGDYKVILPNK